MFWIDDAMLVAGVLLFLGVVTSKISARYGIPMLVPFLGLGIKGNYSSVSYSSAGTLWTKEREETVRKVSRESDFLAAKSISEPSTCTQFFLQSPALASSSSSLVLFTH